jgi:hypothetical protein
MEMHNHGKDISGQGDKMVFQSMFVNIHETTEAVGGPGGKDGKDVQLQGLVGKH